MFKKINHSLRLKLTILLVVMMTMTILGHLALLGLVSELFS